MSMAFNSIEKQVKVFCAQIGADPLLVQGAGGNVSWKDDDVLWVKASGTWLAEAESKEIFVPVNLPHLQDALARQDFSIKPEVSSNAGLRPSIETLLHALMPHKVVVHLHAVEILAHLVQLSAIQNIKTLVADSVKWIYVDYFKPGAELARAVSEELTNRPDADVVFMGNHGVVIGGRSVDDVVATLNTLNDKLKVQPSLAAFETTQATRPSDFFVRGYTRCFDKEVGLLALKGELINRLCHDWAIYPDHVVFLGPKATIINEYYHLNDLKIALAANPPFVFCINNGVYESSSVTLAQKAQLRCYYDVLVRQDHSEKLTSLDNDQISNLLNWDAEIYRKLSN